jgi:GNAT superfamily N-acetyltransferase
MIINEERSSDYLNKSQLKEMANVMSSAFVSHSNFVYTISSDKRRKKALYNIFLMMYKIINIYGFTYLVYEKEEIIGYITFMDSSDKAQISFKRILKTRGLSLVLKFFLLLRFREIKKLISYIKTYDEYQATEEKDYKVHLYSTGVKADFKGKGFMGKAIRNTYQYFKDLGYKEMVLETADPINIPIYNKLGFKTVENRSTPDNKQTICFMAMTL